MRTVNGTAPKYLRIRDLAEQPVQERSVSLFGGCWLHYNGPGSSGFGVKRTAMLLPESAMLMAGPMGCGRSGTVVAEKHGFSHRMFYLNLDDRSVAVGSYIRKISDAVEYIASLGEFKVVLICMTCLDALLGTDLKGLGRKISREVGIPVTTTFMDPIARDGNLGPMVQIRQAITDCFAAPEPIRGDRPADSINVLGTFAPVLPEDELYRILAPAGIRKIKTVAGCRTFEELQGMGGSRGNLLLHPQSTACGQDLKDRLRMPYLPVFTSYVPEQIEADYKRLSCFLQTDPDQKVIAERKDAAEAALRSFSEDYTGIRIAVGEAVQGSPFDIAYALLTNGIRVSYVFRDMIKPSDRAAIEKLAKVAPELPVYSGVHPDTLPGRASLPEADLILGLDAGYYSPGSVSAAWNFEELHYGFGGTIRLIRLLRTSLEHPKDHRSQMKGSYLTV